MTGTADRRRFPFRLSAFRHFGVSAFTLIELLVVVAIIAVLISILVPSLQSATDQARQVMCQSNVKQILTASHMYLNDYDGNWLPAFYLNASGVTTANWYDLPILGTYLDGAIRRLQCPSRPSWQTMGTIGYSWPLGPGPKGLAENGWPYVKDSMIDRPANVPAFMDIGNHSVYTTASWHPAQVNITAMAPRHSGSGNVGYCDGHVEAMEYEKWLTYGGWPEKWLCPWTIH
jgi:prepilin-type processing-associated H-X9-DG protein/prepilin-type N-terminal cleavage/methylation domain-containing protein